jgi:DNA mismatch repair protein MSH6
MECLVEERDPDGVDSDTEEVEEPKDHNITFLYTLGEGACPKSFGINVARLAGLPEELLANAKRISSSFEAELTGMHDENGTNGKSATYTERIKSAVERCEFDVVEKLWRELRESGDGRN